MCTYTYKYTHQLHIQQYVTGTNGMRVENDNLLVIQSSQPVSKPAIDRMVALWWSSKVRMVEQEVILVPRCHIADKHCLVLPRGVSVVVRLGGIWCKVEPVSIPLPVIGAYP